MTYDRLRREALIKQVQGVIDFYDPFSLRELGAPEDEFEPQARRIVDGRCHDAEGCLDLSGLSLPILWGNGRNERIVRGYVQRHLQDNPGGSSTVSNALTEMQPRRREDARREDAKKTDHENAKTRNHET